MIQGRKPSAGKPLFYHDNAFVGRDIAGDTRPAMALERLLVHKADAVINVNEVRAEVLQRRYGLKNQVIVMNCPSTKT
jgi:hypothetical protein